LTELVASAIVPLAAVIIGGALTILAQHRLTRREHDRQWRDIRLSHHREFLAALREYIAYVTLPTTTVTAVPRQREPHDLMPHFADAAKQQRLDAAKTTLRLVSNPEAVEASRAVVHAARTLAAARATVAPADLPTELFDTLWESERAFVRAARAELSTELPGLHGGRG